MPELPEVETVKNILKNTLVGRTIDYVEVFYPRMILSGVDDFVNKMKGATFKDVKRRGKFLLIFLDDDKVIISHLRMEGKYFELEKGEKPTKHCRVLFHLKDGALLNYDDSRCFGIMELHNVVDYLEAPCLAKLGKEPFDIDYKEFYNILQTKKIPIKEALLDQTIISGLGNIYCDEVLYLSKINPYLPANKITLKEAENLIKFSIEVLKKSIKLGGSTVSSYHPSKGVDGRFQNELVAYGKKGATCPRCGHKMCKDYLKGRGTTYCPHCQKVALKIAITGKIGSGKSTALKYFENLGYPSCSADDEVKKLYSNAEFKKELLNAFGEEVLNDNGSISKGYIKNMCINDKAFKKKLESLVHPKIKAIVKQFIAYHKETPFVFVEIPLLFETRMDAMFDYIIGIDCTSTTQILHLENRNANVKSDLNLNHDNQFDRHRKKIHFIIENDGTSEELYKKLDKVLKDLK